MRSLIAAAIALCIGLPAAAQVAEQNKCWLAGEEYSPGATVRASDRVMICADSFTWEPTDSAAAGCIFDGRLYGFGAIETVTRSDALRMECAESGVWERFTE